MQQQSKKCGSNKENGRAFFTHFPVRGWGRGIGLKLASSIYINTSNTQLYIPTPHKLRIKIPVKPKEHTKFSTPPKEA